MPSVNVTTVENSDGYIVELRREAGRSRPPVTFGVFDDKEKVTFQKEPFVQFESLAEAQLWRGITANDPQACEAALNELANNPKFDLNAQMGIGFLRFASPLFHAVCTCEDDDFVIIKLLEQRGARWVSDRGSTPLEICVELSKPKFLQAALCALLEEKQTHAEFDAAVSTRVLKKSGTSKETLSDAAAHILRKAQKNEDQDLCNRAAFVADLLFDLAAVQVTVPSERQILRVQAADESLREFFAAKSGASSETLRLTLGASIVESEHTRHMTAALVLAELRRVAALDSDAA